MGQVCDDEMQRSHYGHLAHDFWKKVPVHFPSVVVDAFVIMPNHLHAIIVIHESSLRAGDEKGEETSPLQVSGEEEGKTGRGAVLAPRSQPPAEGETGAGGKGEETSALQAVGEDEGKTGRGAVLAPSGQARPTSRIKRPTLGQIIAYYKYMTTKQVNKMRGTPGIPFWQRNYWEHVIRTDQALNAIRQYVADNPARWMWDTYNPTATGTDRHAADLWRFLQEDAK